MIDTPTRCRRRSLAAIPDPPAARQSHRRPADRRKTIPDQPQMPQLPVFQQPASGLAQEHEVGVKWKVKR